MKYIDAVIRIVGVISLILLLTGYSNAKGWRHIDLIGLGVWIWHEHEIRKRPPNNKDEDKAKNN